MPITYHRPAGGGISGGGLTGSLWWLPQTGGVGTGGDVVHNEPTVSSGGGYEEFNRGHGLHPGDGGGGYGRAADPNETHADHTGIGYHLNTAQAARLGGLLGGSLLGLPGSGRAISYVINRYGNATGNDNPFPEHQPGVTVTDIDPNQKPHEVVRGGGSDPYGGGYGRDYFGPDSQGNDLVNGANDWYSMMHPNSGLGGLGYTGQGGFGNGGSGGIYDGSGSPWDWNDNYYY